MEGIGVEKDKSARGDREENVKGKRGERKGKKENWWGRAERE